jgi:hypothetical protein
MPLGIAGQKEERGVRDRGEIFAVWKERSVVYAAGVRRCDRWERRNEKERRAQGERFPEESEDGDEPYPPQLSGCYREDARDVSERRWWGRDIGTVVVA